jgi:hypothetical protein
MRGTADLDLNWTAETLRRQAMPAEEIRAVLTAGDLVTVRRHLELHRERLQEWLAREQGTVSSIERILTDRRSTRRS